MTRDLQTALERSTIATLETMCFAAVVGPSQSEHEQGDLLAEVEFEGDECGMLQLDVPLEAARNIASGFLAAPAEDISDDAAGGVVLELANMICGSMLSCYREDGSFKLESPRLVAVPVAADSGSLSCAYQLDSGSIRASVTTKPRAAGKN